MTDKVSDYLHNRQYAEITYPKPDFEKISELCGFRPSRVSGFSGIAGAIVRCEIEIVGTGLTPEGNGGADYSGRCRMLGNQAKAQR